MSRSLPARVRAVERIRRHDLWSGSHHSFSSGILSAVRRLWRRDEKVSTRSCVFCFAESSLCSEARTKETDSRRSECDGRDSNVERRSDSLRSPGSRDAGRRRDAQPADFETCRTAERQEIDPTRLRRKLRRRGEDGLVHGVGYPCDRRGRIRSKGRTSDPALNKRRGRTKDAHARGEASRRQQDVPRMRGGERRRGSSRKERNVGTEEERARQRRDARVRRCRFDALPFEARFEARAKEGTATAPLRKGPRLPSRKGTPFRSNPIRFPFSSSQHPPFPSFEIIARISIAEGRCAASSEMGRWDGGAWTTWKRPFSSRPARRRSRTARRR